MRRVLPAEAAVLAELEPLRRLLLVLRRAVVPALAVAAREMNDVSHGCYSKISRDGARADRAAALANREARALLERHRRDAARP